MVLRQVRNMRDLQGNLTVDKYVDRKINQYQNAYRLDQPLIMHNQTTLVSNQPLIMPNLSSNVSN